MAGTCECGNEPSGSIKCGEFLDGLGQISISRRTVLLGVSKYVMPYQKVVITLFN